MISQTTTSPLYLETTLNSFDSSLREAQSKIYRQLDFNSQLAIRMTCKKWLELSRQFQFVLKPKMLDRDIACRFPNLKQLSLPNLQLHEKKEKQFEILKTIKGLKVLSLRKVRFENPVRNKDHVDNDYLLELSKIPALFSLEELHLSCCLHCRVEELKHFANLPNLKLLTGCIPNDFNNYVAKLDLNVKYKIEFHSIFCYLGKNYELTEPMSFSEKEYSSKIYSNKLRNLSMMYNRAFDREFLSICERIYSQNGLEYLVSYGDLIRPNQ